MVESSVVHVSVLQSSGQLSKGLTAVSAGKLSSHSSHVLLCDPCCVQGARREVLRALCQLVNSTELTLEASLVEVEDADWQMVAARAGSVTVTFSADAVEEEVFENERFARGPGGSQWSAGNLAATGDPRHFMYALHEADAFPQVGVLPASWLQAAAMPGALGWTRAPGW